jgi:hypothetical protein
MTQQSSRLSARIAISFRIEQGTLNDHFKPDRFNNIKDNFELVDEVGPAFRTPRLVGGGYGSQPQDLTADMAALWRSGQLGR